MMDSLKLAEMLCTRLCHDLTGPIGAVNNGAEFLAEEGFNLQNQAVELITSSAFSAVTRLQFYRVAYGRVKEHGEASLTDSQRLAQDFFAGSKITLVWPDQYADAVGVSLSLRMMRLLFNLLIVMHGALFKGGTVNIRIDQGEGGQKIIEMLVQGDAIKWDSEMQSVLMQPCSLEQVTPKSVQLYLTRTLADELQTSLTFEPGPGELRIRAVQQARETESD